MSSMALKILSLRSTFTEEEPNQETKSRTRLWANSRLEKFSVFNRQLYLRKKESKPVKTVTKLCLLESSLHDEKEEKGHKSVFLSFSVAPRAPSILDVCSLLEPGGIVCGGRISGNVASP